jgi:cyclopropane fatty-acyl-phospholipid synthase-like methyltransferase
MRSQNLYWQEYWSNKEWSGNHYEMNDYKPGRDLPPIDPETHRRRIVVPVLEILDLQPHHHALDIGCGSGLLLREIEKKVERAVGTDISQSMLDQFEGESQTFCVPANELPFGDNSFDRIVMWGVALYFPSFDYFKDVVEKCIAMLRPNGVLLLGDLIIATGQKVNPKFMQYDALDLMQFLDNLDRPYTLFSHISLRKRVNNRKSIVINSEYIPE